MTGRARTLRAAAVLVALGLAVHLVLPRVASLEASLAVLRALRGWPLAGAAAAQAASYWASGVMLRRIVRTAGREMSTGRKVSIIPRGIGALGYTLQRPTEDRA